MGLGYHELDHDCLDYLAKPVTQQRDAAVRFIATQKSSGTLRWEKSHP